jgi:hypothetical protein
MGDSDKTTDTGSVMFKKVVLNNLQSIDASVELEAPRGTKFGPYPIGPDGRYEASLNVNDVSSLLVKLDYPAHHYGNATEQLFDFSKSASTCYSYIETADLDLRIGTVFGTFQVRVQR